MLNIIYPLFITCPVPFTRPNNYVRMYVFENYLPPQIIIGSLLIDGKKPMNWREGIKRLGDFGIFCLVLARPSGELNLSRRCLTCFLPKPPVVREMLNERNFSRQFIVLSRQLIFSHNYLTIISPSQPTYLQLFTLPNNYLELQNYIFTSLK